MIDYYYDDGAEDQEGMPELHSEGAVRSIKVPFLVSCRLVVCAVCAVHFDSLRAVGYRTGWWVASLMDGVCGGCMPVWFVRGLFHCCCNRYAETKPVLA